MNETTMESTLAGAWYDADPVRLRRELRRYLDAAEVEADPSLFAVVMPHAGYAFSGPCAAYGAKAVAGMDNLRRVVVLGFTHRIRMPNEISVPWGATSYRSPLGETPLDRETITRLFLMPKVADVPVARKSENSVEMTLPLLQAALVGREWSLVPIVLGQLDDAARAEFAAGLSEIVDEQTALVVSSDFTHYGPRFGYVPFRSDVEENLRRLDAGAIERALAGDSAGFAGYCEETGATICGQDSIGVLLRMLPPGFRARELAYDTSGRQTGDFENTVSYSVLAFYRKESP
jgi:MEMO1 family protein